MSLTIIRKVSVTGGTVLRAANNLGDVASAATARTNLGVPSTAEVAAAAAPLINPRAPRQALAFDGTAGCSVANVAAFGTKDFTLSVWVLHKGVVGYIFGSDASGSGFELGLRANGNIFSAHSGSGFTDIATGLTANVFHHLCYSRTGGTGTFLVNGVSVGTQADSYDYTSSNAAFGKNHAGTFPFTGVLSQPLSYNRALSAAEVLALYEQGAPAAADFNSASNTAINTATATNDGSFPYTSLTGATAAAFTAVKASGGAYAKFNPIFALTAGQRINVSGTLTLNNGKTVLPSIAVLTSGLSGITAGVALTGAGAFSIELICTSAGNGYVTVSTVGDADFTLSGVVVKRTGLLCAPEANAPGNGLEWLDTSGIRAHIVLPTSGATWALLGQGAIVIEATTNTATNQQLGGASLIDTNKQWRIQSWTVHCSTGTPAISLGNVSAGTQYVSAAVLAAGNNDITLLTRFPSTANLWCNSSTTATLIHRIVLVPAN